MAQIILTASARMNRSLQLLFLANILLANAAFLPALANAAFLVEAHSSGLANATNFAILPGAGNATGATASSPSNAVGTTASNSIFASNNTVSGVADTYEFSYTPGTDADNTGFGIGNVLGSKNGFPGDGNRATGFAGGVSGFYNVYFTTNSSANVNTSGSNFTITQDGAPTVLPSVNLNNAGTGPNTNPVGAFVGGANNSWELLGTVHLTAGSQYTVTQTSNADSFVSQRAHGLMWELVSTKSSIGIRTWEYIDPLDPSQGKRESATPTPGGADVIAAPFVHLSARNLTMAYLTGEDLNGANLSRANLSDSELSHSNLANSNLTRANLTHANLSSANLSSANLMGATLDQAILTGANVTGANLGSTRITLDQLYSTVSYLNRDFTGTHFVGHDLSGANLAGQILTATNFYAGKLVGANFTNATLTNAEFVNADLTQANLSGASLTSGSLALANLNGADLKNANLSGTNFIGTNLAGADIRGANLSPIQFLVAEDPLMGYYCGPKHNGLPCNFSKPLFYWGIPILVVQTVGTGITLSQLTSTASYAARDLSGVTLANSHLNGADFAGFNLTNSNFGGTRLDGADFSGADARGAIGLSEAAASNFIRPDGHIAGLNLAAGETLVIRNYDAPEGGTAIPIRVDQQFSLTTGATLQMIFDADAWDSEISFATGIPVLRGGTLDLAFVPGIDVAGQVGRTFDLFDWTGVTPMGTFVLASDYSWDFTNLYTTGVITLLGIGSGAGLSGLESPTAPEPSAIVLLGIATLIGITLRNRGRVPATLALLLIVLAFGAAAEAAAPVVPLTKVGNPSWRPVDFQLFSAPATPFFETFGNVYNNLLPHDTPLATTYVPHPGPYDTELSENAAAAGYVSHTLFPPQALTLDPNGLYIGFMLVPDPGIVGSSRDFASGPVIPNSVFPIASNGDIWLDEVLVDRLLGADFFQSVGARDAGYVGTSHLEFLQAIWHPWDDDLAVGPLGRYDFRLSVRDNSGAGWDGHMRFRVAIPGDYDYSGTVGPEDHAVWKANFGSTTNLDADGNDDHIIDAADYTIWRNNVGLSYSGGGSILNLAAQSPAVPEPSLPALVSLAALGALFLNVRSGR